ncbi:MAG: cupin domain-containing protein [Nannocystaceae bacterium]
MTDPEDPQRRLRHAATRMREAFDEGSPAALRGLGPLVSPAELFDRIKQAHPPARARTSRDKLHAVKRSWGLSPQAVYDPSAPDPGRSAEIYRDGALVLDPSPFLPSEEDASCEQWVARARAALGGDFGLQAPGLECASWEALDRLQALLAPVLAVTGPRTYRFNAFAGDYRRTPFGFHIDPHQEAVFQVVLTGRRRGYFWEGLTLHDEDAAWIEDSNGLVPPGREPESVIELEPGDVVFWPGTHVHGFETDGPSLALSIVVDRASPRSRPEVVAGLEHATMGGRTALPPVQEHPPLTLDDLIERRSAFALRYERFDDSLLVGVCGRTIEWPDRNSVPAAMRLFDRLGGRVRHSVRALVGACTDETLTDDEILEVLTTLTRFGHLRRASGNGLQEPART